MFRAARACLQSAQQHGAAVGAQRRSTASFPKAAQHRMQLGWAVSLFLMFVAMPTLLMKRISMQKTANAAAVDGGGGLGSEEEEHLLRAIRDRELQFRQRIDAEIAHRKRNGKD
eukprot:TRINITY_DN26947_c0_g1_i1.p2 TRINITY_DN26947_c0_g1~~TRINITY_DN26947_c0_g1_i1.p2  ORF type:complete len:114 (+),score=9.98 TRINITY_DN26947_c0_g1_i1:97-438(+)